MVWECRQRVCVCGGGGGGVCVCVCGRNELEVYTTWSMGIHNANAGNGAANTMMLLPASSNLKGISKQWYFFHFPSNILRWTPCENFIEISIAESKAKQWVTFCTYPRFWPVLTVKQAANGEGRSLSRPWPTRVVFENGCDHATSAFVPEVIRF